MNSMTNTLVELNSSTTFGVANWGSCANNAYAGQISSGWEIVEAMVDGLRVVGVSEESWKWIGQKEEAREEP